MSAAADDAGDPRGQPALRVWQRGGLIVAAIVFGVVLACPIPALDGPAHRLAAIVAGVMLLWITEALPMPLTALIGAAACVILRVAPARDVFASFADPLMFLFIGAFILARALFLHRLDRRLAFGILSLPWIDARPGRVLFAFGAVTACISAFVANTATTAMMFAIALSIIGLLVDSSRDGGPAVSPRFATGLMLMATFASSVGGLATPVGAAPNLIGIGFLRELLGVEFSFVKWCVVAVPAVVVLFLYLAAYLGVLCRAGVRELPGGRALFRAELDKLGPWTTGQRSTLLACAATVSLWLAPGVLTVIDGEAGSLSRAFQRSCPEPIAALVGAILLFLLPGERGGRAITWEQAVRIDWGIILLFGGGLALGVLSFRTGLAEALGRGLAAAVPAHNELAMLALATVTAALVSEVTSNTASANMVVPVMIAVSQAAEVDPLAPALGATLGSGLGFMLPVSTPCNAIVYSSGHVPLRRMIGYGLLLDVVSVSVIIGALWLLLPLVR
jgi:sodium-dependent dicarboxylate transporter 2/3/5